MSNFIIYNADRVRIGLLQNVDSIQWLENYQGAGEAKIVAKATEDNIAMLVIGNRIYNTDSDTSVKVCDIEITESDAEGIMTIRADMTAQLLAERVVMATERVTNVEAGMYSVYSRNRRNLPVTLAAAEGYTETTETEITWNSVLDAEITLAESSGLGFKVIFEPNAGTETFEVYKGTDRTSRASENYVGYLGPDAENLQNISIVSSVKDFKNVAVVAGADSGASRKVRIVSLGTVAGEDRREMYVDARDLQQEYQTATFTGNYDDKGNPIYTYTTSTYTTAQYNAILDNRGYEKLAEQLATLTISCDIVQNNIFFGTDYFLGDRMPIKVPEYGLFATAVISSVNRIYEKEGNRISVQLNQFELED